MTESQFLMNRIANSSNRFQTPTPRVLCVCSAGLLRSPTLANILAQHPYHFNTRAVGAVPEFALIPVDDVLVEWADLIVCVDSGTARRIRDRWEDPSHQDKLVVLDIEDRFEWMQEELQSAIRYQLSQNDRIVALARKTIDDIMSEDRTSE